MTTQPTLNAWRMRDQISGCAGFTAKVMPDPNARLFGSKALPVDGRKKRKRTKTEREAGFALIFAIGVLAVLGVSSAAAMSYAVSNEHAAQTDADRQAALQAADSGVNLAVDQLVSGHVPEGQATVGEADVVWTGEVVATGWLLTATATIRDTRVGSRALLQNGHLVWLG